MKKAKHLTLFCLLLQSADLTSTLMAIVWAGLARVGSQGSSRIWVWSSWDCSSLRWHWQKLQGTAVHSLTCHLRCAERLEPVLLTAWCAQMHLVVNAIWAFSQVPSSCTKNVGVYQLIATGREKKTHQNQNTQRRGVFHHLCPGKVGVTAAHDTLGFWQSSGWFCSADIGWSMLSVLPFSRNASSILDYYRGCSVSVSSFCRVWVHMKWDQESLVGCAWLWAESLLERCVFLAI